MASPEKDLEAVILEAVGVGEQSYVFGNDRWVVKIWRCSLFSMLAKWVTRRRWLEDVRESLGGLVAPFLLLEDVEFTAPKMSGRERLVKYRPKSAVARVRYESTTFLDHQLSLAEPAEALALVEEMLTLVERVRARGFYMHDFIMKNFVVVDGRLLIADPGLIVPISSFWEPGMRICAWGFWRGLSKDYQRLLGELLDEVGEGEDDGALHERITACREALPARLCRLRQRPVGGLESEGAEQMRFDPVLGKEIRQSLGSVR